MRTLRGGTPYLMALFVSLSMVSVAQAQKPGGDKNRNATHCGKCKCCERHKNLLAKFDKDGDGKLTGDEQTAAKEFVQQQRKNKQLEKFDKDGDGELSEEEKDAMKQARIEARNKRKAELLKKYDADGDGKLNAEERKTMKEALTKKCSCPKRKRRGRRGGKKGKGPDKSDS